MLPRLLPILLAPAMLVACTGPIAAPGSRGHTQPRHIKPESYEKRNVPRTPMRTHHVLEIEDDCGNDCDFRQTAESKVMLHLQENGVARAEDTGALVEQVVSRVATSATETKWKRTWTGSWSEGDDSLEVLLEPEEVGCTRTDGNDDEPCAERQDLRLRCRLVQLSLVRPRNAATRAWACRARGLRNVSTVTPPPWVFGISEPVVILDGGSSHAPTRRYARATPATASDTPSAPAPDAE